MAEYEYLSMAENAEFEIELSSAFNPEADANAQLAPFPKGIYVLNVTFQESDPDTRWIKKMRKGTTELYCYANVVGEIADNPANAIDYVGRRVFSNVMTLIQKNTGTTSAQALIQAAGMGERLLVMPRSHNTQVNLLNDALQSGALVGAECDWEASLYDAATDTTIFRLRGMKSFPKDAAGNPIPVGISSTGTEVPARNVLKRWLTLEQVAELQAKDIAVEEEEEVPEEQVAPVAAAVRPAAKPAPPVALAKPAVPAAVAKPLARRAVPTR